MLTVDVELFDQSFFLAEKHCPGLSAKCNGINVNSFRLESFYWCHLYFSGSPFLTPVNSGSVKFEVFARKSR